ncbi:hypothetical protein ACGFJT_37345 [Actinomadura geliboluensis]|uniref:hypothetical protein n=1 Tax=Actinomadura geliboluensis TaxID=882440 RepID=UPI0037157899
MTAKLSPGQIAAAIRDPNSGLMPALIAVRCDTCGTTAEHDYLVRETSTPPERFQVARRHLTEHEGWCCDGRGDFCPACARALPETRKATEAGQ